MWMTGALRYGTGVQHRDGDPELPAPRHVSTLVINVFGGAVVKLRPVHRHEVTALHCRQKALGRNVGAKVVGQQSALPLHEALLPSSGEDEVKGRGLHGAC